MCLHRYVRQAGVAVVKLLQVSCRDILSVVTNQSIVAKTADLIIMMLDATKSMEQRRLLEIELDAVGIRLNKRRPDVVVKRKTTGGVPLPRFSVRGRTH